ncbi:MAG: hypothetical protein JWL95_2840 [Gemmatimonadetes bacterium]|nr:hypothetical protein [Gemmatimonadota bacterium]
MLKTVPFLLFAGAAAFVSSSTIRDVRDNAAFKGVPVVTVHAKDFSFVAPASIAPGQTTFRLVNDGKQLHHLSIMKLEHGKTYADFQAAMKKPGPPPAWLVSVGGPNAAVPGGSVDATLTLEAGSYVIACFIPSPGEEMPHMMKGMVQPLTVSATGGVVQAGAAFAPAPVPEIHLVMKDYGFTFSKPLTAGKHVIHVMNEGPQDHEAIFVKLAPGKHATDFTAWASTGMKGPPPAMPVDGMAGMSKGRAGIFTTNLTPGTYALVCFVPDTKDGKFHAVHGMSSEFEVK